MAVDSKRKRISTRLQRKCHAVNWISLGNTHPLITVVNVTKQPDTIKLNCNSVLNSKAVNQTQPEYKFVESKMNHQNIMVKPCIVASLYNLVTYDNPKSTEYSNLNQVMPIINLFSGALKQSQSVDPKSKYETQLLVCHLDTLSQSIHVSGL